MARTKLDPTVVRPRCTKHPDGRIRLDGFRHCPWSDAHRRPRYRCVTEPGTRGHSFSMPVAVRQPTERHPDSGTACPTCEHVYGRHEGVRTGRDFVVGHAEIARLLARVGEGMSLRAASRDLREHLLRVANGGPSRQASLAVNYVDMFAPAILAELHPVSWPRVVVLDTTTLFTRGFRPDPDEVTDAAVPTKAGNLKAGTILVALDGSARRPMPVLMRVAGAKDTESWKAFFRLLSGAPEVVVADLDGAIGRAVRETWPGAAVMPSRHHLAAQIRERLVVDGVAERIRLETPVATLRPLPWTGERVRRFGPHPLHEGALGALRGPASWAAFCDLVERELSPERLALRSWIATNEPLIRRSWLVRGRRPDVPLPAPSKVRSASGWRRSAGEPDDGRTPAGWISCLAS